MTSIATAVFNATIGLLVNKGRDLTAEKLKVGDVTDQQFRNLIVREINDIKSRLDGLARKDLLASFSFFKEGLEFLYQLFDQTTSGELATSTARAAMGTEEEKLAVSLRSVNTDSLAKGLKNLDLTELDEPAKQALSDAKLRFMEARRKATEAFSNEALKTSDRTLAMTIRVMATLLEKVDNPATALSSCRVCLDELHNMPAVQNSVKVELAKGFKSLFNRNERGEVIANVVHMNFTSPCIDIGKGTIDPLRNARLVKTLRESNMEHCCLSWSFGQEGDEDHRLRGPAGITTNTRGQLIVVDQVGGNVKVFNTSGKFLYSLCPPTDDADKELRFRPYNVATDGEDNVYVLAILKRGGTVEWQGVYVFDQHANLHHKFPLREGSRSMTVSEHHQVFVLVLCDAGGYEVEVYDADGRFVHSFGLGILKHSCDITAVNNDRVMVLNYFPNCVHVFSAQGDHLHQFTVRRLVSSGGIAFHQASEHVVVSSRNPDNKYRGQVSIYTKDGEFVRSVQLDTEKEPWLKGVTVTVDGRIAVTSWTENKVNVTYMKLDGCGMDFSKYVKYKIRG